MISPNQKYQNEILYREQHGLKSYNGTVIERVVTIYKPDKTALKELLLDITDSNNPFTLFVMKITHEDFNIIKVNQGLTLDFSLFPDKLIHLLQQTKIENSRVYLHIEDMKSNGVDLSIREEGTIKHVTHLSLKFQCASELEIKEKVLDHIKIIEKSQETKEHLNSELNRAIFSMKEELQKKEHLIYELKNKYKQQFQELENKISSQAAVIELNNQQIASDKETVEQLRTAVNVHRDDIQRLKATINDLDDEKNVLKKDNDILKVRLSETTNQFDRTNNEYKQLEKDLNIVKVRLKISIDETNKKTSEIDALIKKTDEMKRIINNKQNIENTLQSQLSEASKKIRMLSEQNSQYSIDLRSTNFELNELQEKYRFNCSDLNKANQIISRLQGELRTIKSVKAEIQNRLSESVSSEKDLKDEVKKQDTKINELKKKITKYEEELEVKDKQIQNFNIEKSNLQKALTSAYRELAEVKQGNPQGGKYPFSVGDKNMDAYYFKKFIQGSKSSDVQHKVPVVNETPKDQEKVTRGDGKEAEKVIVEKVSSVLHGANKSISSARTSVHGNKSK